MEAKKISQEAFPLFAMGKLSRVSDTQKGAMDAGFDKVMDSSMQKSAVSDTKEAGASVHSARKDLVQKDVLKGQEPDGKTPSIRQKPADDRMEAKDPGKDLKDGKEACSEEGSDLASVVETVLTGTLPGKEEKVSEEVTEALNQMITQAVSEVLGVSEGEVKEFLGQKGMVAADLLQPDSLKEFLLSWQGETDMTAFLVNADLKESYDILTEAFSTILPEDFEDKGVAVSEEELAQVMKVLSEPQAAGVQKQVPAEGNLSEEPVPVDEKEEGVQISVEVTRSTKEEAQTEQEAAGEETPQTEHMLKADSSEKESGWTKPVESFIQHLEQSVTNVEGTTVTERVVQYREIVNQVVEQIKVVIKPESTSLSMQLNPEQLGRVALHMTMKNGQMTASFFVQNEMAKEALESNLQTLRENLSAQGLKVESVEVSVSDFSLSGRGDMEYGQDAQTGEENKGQPQGKQRRLLRMEELEGAAELTEEEEEAKSRMEASGSTVDFTA